ncbi:OLC1v1014889C3 [Oldenlandia corymbosa var. corymbosa]|uniref:Auxin-responsive protein n=1 Tax=Oldenlandia corymbosa var. corymbosa TaxID=529605 RepID=A0AAV1E5C5_OLDCO|nr:OLC1v1014889C3 [Oldenlandia corymbosa var. corymbosa]
MEGCPKLLDLIPKEGEWNVKMEAGRDGVSEEKKLELRLGPPGGDESSSPSLPSFNRFPNMMTNVSTTSGMKRGFTDTANGSKQAQKFPSFSDDHVFSTTTTTPWSTSSSSSAYNQGKGHQPQQQQTKGNSSFLQLQSTSQCLPAVMSKESSQHCCPKTVDLQTAEKKAFSSTSSANTAVPNSTAQKRTTAPAPVVGWPPIRSFRKNLASSSNLKSTSGSLNNTSKITADEKVKTEKCQQLKGLFVKINMDGVPIGRKVDLNAYDSYDKLSSAVDELFRGLLAAQGDSPAGGIQNNNNGREGEKVISGLLDGSGEYTLVYEDNEGDRMLVGDVPWHMFVSTVKRLRVLKSSEISKLCRKS